MSFDVDTLTSPQRAALGQLQAITNGADIPSEIAILSSVNWDVQRAAEAIFDSQASGSTSTRPKFEQMHLDDSAQAPVPRPHRPAILRVVLSIVSFPLSLSFNIISFLFRFLRIPFPRLAFSGLSFSFPSRRGPRAPADDPAAAADRLVRALEDETGAQVLSRARARDGPGPSSSALPDALFDDSRKVLPDFWLGSYESALDVAKRDARVLCVVLLSAEHDDVPAFRRHVLTDPGLVRVLAEQEFVVWAGDVRERDAYQASLKLTATTYPFVAFIALQPRVRGTGTSSSSSSPALAILSRHAGLAATTAPLLTEHITTTLLPRHQSFLARLQAQARARQHDRALREEQDAAFAAAQQADAQRILRRRAEEAERARAISQEQIIEQGQRRAALRRALWRRKALERLEKEGDNVGAGGGIRVGVRVPDGRRAVRWFREGDQVADVYAWVDGVLAEGPGQERGNAADAVQDGEGDIGAVEDADVPEWPFRLAVAFPRSAVPCVPGQRVGDVAALRGGGNLVVEGITPAAGDGSESEEES